MRPIPDPFPAFSRPFPAPAPSLPLPRLRPAPSSPFRLFSHVHSTVLHTGFHGRRGVLDGGPLGGLLGHARDPCAFRARCAVVALFVRQAAAVVAAHRRGKVERVDDLLGPAKLAKVALGLAQLCPRTTNRARLCSVVSTGFNVPRAHAQCKRTSHLPTCSRYATMTRRMSSRSPCRSTRSCCEYISLSLSRWSRGAISRSSC